MGTHEEKITSCVNPQIHRAGPPQPHQRRDIYPHHPPQSQSMISMHEEKITSHVNPQEQTTSGTTDPKKKIISHEEKEFQVTLLNGDRVHIQCTSISDLRQQLQPIMNILSPLIILLDFNGKIIKDSD